AIPGAALPDSLYHPYRLDPGPRFKTEGIADHVPPRIGPRYVALVPQVDADGNEIAGIRLPEVAVPLVTYTGWYLRDPEFSRTLRRNAGRSWPLPRTAQEREATGDPRPAILERYPTRADYLFKVSKIVMELRRQRLLLDEDVPRLLELALEQTYWNGPDDVSAQRIISTKANPPTIPRGGTVRLIVAIDGDPTTVRHVRARFREADDWTLHFNDEGRDGDEKASDGLWTTRFEMPQAVPPAKYHFDVEAKDTDFAVVGTAAAIEGAIVVSVE
ncbi:MAG: hypothetical protein GY856_55530, partial [bacterium]|nr:hypothetical protein [bacterium]